jgi:hypothetical protein
MKIERSAIKLKRKYYGHFWFIINYNYNIYNNDGLLDWIMIGLVIFTARLYYFNGSLQLNVTFVNW